MDPSLIEDRFKKMSNEEIQVFANNERGKISPTALRILEKVFIQRKLDTSFFEIDRTQAENYKNSIENGKIKDSYFNNWQYALNMRINSKTNEEIKNALIHKLCSLYESGLIIGRLPEFGFINSKFKNLVSKSMAFGFDKWLKIIKFMPDSIVLITPIIEKRKAFIFLTVETKLMFKLQTNLGKSFIIECENTEDHTIFFEGVKDHFPHAHIGHAYEVNKLYIDDAENFLKQVINCKLYNPFDCLTMENKFALLKPLV